MRRGKRNRRPKKNLNPPLLDRLLQPDALLSLIYRPKLRKKDAATGKSTLTLRRLLTIAADISAT